MIYSISNNVTKDHGMLINNYLEINLDNIKLSGLKGENNET